MLCFFLWNPVWFQCEISVDFNLKQHLKLKQNVSYQTWNFLNVSVIEYLIGLGFSKIFFR